MSDQIGAAEAVRREAGELGEAAGRVLAEAAGLVQEMGEAERWTREERFRREAGRVLEEHLAAAVAVPEGTKEKLRWRLAPGLWVADVREAGVDEGLAAYAERVAAAFEAEAETLRGLESERGTRPLVRGCGAVRVVVEAERQGLAAQLMMDRVLGLDGGLGAEDADWRRGRELGLVAGLPRCEGIREAYARLTGDWEVSGFARPGGVWPGLASRSGWGGMESAGGEWAGVVREANEVTSGVLNYALANSATKLLVKEYRSRPQEWQKFCHVTRIENFKSQDRVRLYDFGSLPVVPEGAAYQNAAWGNAREVYAAAKRGNLVAVSREAILNDDVGAITQIPRRLARAAYTTLNEFVYGLFTGNPQMADGSKVFDDGSQATHGNRGTAALSAGSVEAAITAMMKQTNSAGKRLNLSPRYLLVPADLYFMAQALCQSERRPGSANNDTNVLRGKLEPIAVAQFSDPTDWYLVCDPQTIESIEIGFVGGREEPELFVQDAVGGGVPGQVFTNDQILFKVRWSFGGGWIDYRGAYWSQVAG